MEAKTKTMKTIFKMKQIKEKELFDIVKGCDRETLNDVGFGVHLTSEGFDEEIEYRVYISEGYCFDIRREKFCEATEVPPNENIHKDGYCYEFWSGYEGFKSLTIENAIEKLKKH